jgi:hypothetical protein
MGKPKNIQKIEFTELGSWLGSTGFIYPQNDIELERFNKLYENYDFQLKSEKIDPLAIIGDKFLEKFEKTEPKIIRFKEEAESLRMVARKGAKKIPQHIIDKMLKKHKDQDGN